MLNTHYEVLIVGAGISGISAAYHLQKKCKDLDYAIIDKRHEIGGTWSLFQYPGIRSDSDMQTMGFSFKPWIGEKSIAPGPEIKAYVQETADQFGISDKIEFNIAMSGAKWDSTTALWTVNLTDKAGKKKNVTCSFLYMCNGYYRYEEGYLPEFKGFKDYKGEVFHPQHWPENLDYKNKEIIIVGSGATAVTLLPSMADDAKHITLLQRTPTYMVSAPATDEKANFLRKILPDTWAHSIIRVRNILLQRFMFWLAKTKPEKVKGQLISLIREQLGEDYDVEKHFTPPYNPWEQRMCLVPDNDFFQSIKSGKASMVTEQIDQFTADGIKLQNGDELKADIIIVATGINMEILTQFDFEVDNQKVDVTNCVVYKGAMLSNVPNMAFTMGYANASWTLKADITGNFVSRILNFMKRHGYNQCNPVYEGGELGKKTILELNSGYVERAKNRVPKQGIDAPWQLRHNYLLDRMTMNWEKINDNVLTFSYPTIKHKKQPISEQSAA